MTQITLFCSGCKYYPYFEDISPFRGYYPHFVDISEFCGYFPRFVVISTFHGYYSHFVDISAFHGYYLHFVDIIHIGHIMSYLALNVCNVLHSFVPVVDIICIGHILHSFVLVVDIIYIGHITSYLARNFHPIFEIYSFSGSDWFINYFTV